MSKLIKTDAEYSRWIQELKERYRYSQIKAATQVNREMLRYYWSLGRDIVARDAENVYGSGFYRNLSQDLKSAIPEAKGFSRQNLQYMKKMYLLYGELTTNCQQPVGISQEINDNIIFSVPWGHHCTLIDKYFETGEREIALFYAHKVVEYLTTSSSTIKNTLSNISPRMVFSHSIMITAGLKSQISA